MSSTRSYVYADGKVQQQKAHALLPFLQSQSQNTLTKLYSNPSSCLSMFRLLDPISRQLIMNLLWLESAIPASTMAAWVTWEGKPIYTEALTTLAKLHIFPNSAIKLAVVPTFQTSFRQAITGGGSFGVSLEKDDKRSDVDIEFLDVFALERWETILHYMVSSGSGQNPTKPSVRVLFLLQRSGLMTTVGQGLLQITSTGFQFLLHSPHEQLWELLLQYLHLTEERQMDLVDVLGFLFMLSTMELGREYSTERLSKTQTAMLEDLVDYGLIWRRKPSSKRFHPTRLATTLTSSSPPLPSQSTNYRMYAYTDNPLQTAILNLFVAFKYRFPNLVVGTTTRDSVKKALLNGISADQSISYLMSHAHPQMRKNNPLLPITVQDQIRLWELEKNRLKSQEGMGLPLPLHLPSLLTRPPSPSHPHSL
ncbi:hypothetical protein K443DRAFT_685300 [Laccaria amethystina LaAM-08-1]|uniref:RNA polymerase II transcription factor B subunit 2 n=1 Tax=Laccaria amethystina LaAM-08-1 TaxID=1095629 RepID=A0A0C9X7K1_9AGAR|nr:hypothetical protein K443DRAFT_685300 [Laccaria amethystina LaAM-08-1]